MTEAAPIQKVIIVGAGASIPYGFPVARELLETSIQRVVRRLYAQHKKFVDQPFRPYNTPAHFHAKVSNGKDIDHAVLTAIGGPAELEKLADAFQHDLVQQNLDEFVRDHPSFTNAVSMLIAVALFEKMYEERNGLWALRNALTKGGKPPHEDWMRSLVGILRPKLSKENRLAVISFNYDALLERSMRMYWPGSETKYAQLADCVAFVYPHGNFTELPDQMPGPVNFLKEQAANLRLGENKDVKVCARAKQLIAEADRIYSVGFSFSADNASLLGLSDEGVMQKCVIQNFDSRDVRLNRLMDSKGVPPEQRDQGDMDALIRHGFFEM